MALETIFVSYVKFNLLVLLSFVLWETVKFAQEKRGRFDSALFRLRTARFLFISPLLLPVATILLALNSPTPDLMPAEVLAVVSQQTGVNLIALVMTLVVAGILGSAIKLVLELFKLRRLIRESIPLKKQGNISLLYNPGIKIPFATGFLRKKTIVLPEDLLLSRENLHIVLKHEGHHIRSGDLYWSFLARLNSILCFWNPAAYAWKQILHNLQELACDEYLTSKTNITPDAYAECLFSVAAYENYQQYSLVTPMSLWRRATIAQAPNLKIRINLLYSKKAKRKFRFLMPSMTTLCMAVISLVLFGQAIPGNTAENDAARRFSVIDSDRGAAQQENDPVIAPTFQPDPYWGPLTGK